MLLAVDLRPGPLVDEVVLTASEQPGQFNATLGLAIPQSDGATIDVSRPADFGQRYAGPTADGPRRFAIDPSREYLVRGEPNPGVTDDFGGDFGFRPFDRDGLAILPTHVTRHGAAADTTLVVPLSPGDRSFVIADASGWSNEPWLSNETRALAWYGYRDSGGRVYDDYTYTRQVATGDAAGLWSSDSIWYDASATGYRVILNEPWEGPVVPAGAAVRNATDGPELLRPLIDATGFDGPRWPVQEATLSGEWVDGRRDERSFPPGTATIELQARSIGFWEGIELVNPGAIEHPPTETFAGLGERRSRAVLNPAESARTNQPGDFNHDGVIDAADYTVWRDSALNADARGIWRAAYGVESAPVVESVDATYGRASIIDGEIHYTSAEWFVGSDVVEYTLLYPATGARTALQTIVSTVGSNFERDPDLEATVAAQAQDPENNAAPRLFVSSGYAVEAGGELVADGARNPGLLENIRSTDDEVVVRLVAGPRHGSLDFQSDGTFVYRPEDGYVGEDSFRFEYFDGVNAVAERAYLNVAAADEALLTNRMRSVALGMLNYESSFGRFPANISDESGTQLLSWRVALLPFLEHSDLYDQFRLDEPWDSPHNLALAERMPDPFRSVGAPADTNLTRFQVVDGGGPEFFWRGTEGLEGPRAAQVVDGLANSFLFVESAEDAAVPWTKPDDIGFDVSDPVGSLGGLAGDRFFAATADGAVGAYAADLSAEDFTALATIAGDEVIDAATLRRQLRDAAGEAVPDDEQDVSRRLRNLILAAINYADTRGSFPVDSLLLSDDPESNARGLSWRVELLPFLGQSNLYDRFRHDEPWDSPHNLALLQEMPDVFRSAGDSASSTTTRFLRPEGPDAPFFNQPGSERGVEFRRITDGTSDTLFAYEAAPSAAVPWTKPEDIAFDLGDTLALIAGVASAEVNAVFYDGSFQAIPATVSEPTLAALVTHRGGEVIDPVDGGRERKVEETSFDRVRDLQSLSLATLNHADATGLLPTDVLSRDGENTPLLSWRVRLLPFLEYESLYEQFRLDEPWDSPHNLKLLPLMPDVYRSVGDPADARTTRIHHLTGPDTVYRLAGNGEPIRPQLRDVVDGTFNTINLVEAGPETAVPWTKPSDLPLSDNNPYSPLGELDGQFLAAFFDGHVETLPVSLPPSELRALVTRNGGEVRGQAPEITIDPGLTVLESAGDTVMNEFGADLFHVVLDTRPASNVVVDVVTSDSGVATLDRTRLTFTPDDWDTPQRVALAGVDNFLPNSEQIVWIGLSVVNALSVPIYAGVSQSFTATVRDDEPVAPPLPGDFNADGVVDAADRTLWRDALGSLAVPFSGADANGDGSVTPTDRSVWASHYGQTLGEDASSQALALLVTSGELSQGENQDEANTRSRFTSVHRESLVVPSARSRDQVVQHVPLHIREAHVPTPEAVGRSFVIDT